MGKSIPAGALLLLVAARLAAQQPAARPAPARPDTSALHAAHVDSAQKAHQAALDSLADRVQQAEETIQRLQHQLEEQAQAKVESRLKNHLEISGLVLVNGFYNGAKMNVTDAPGWVALSQDTTGLPNSQLGGTLRQTRLGVSLRSAPVLGADLSGDLQMDFYGNAGQDAGTRLASPLRIRTASVRMDWPHLGVMVGQDAPLIAPQNPVSFAQSGFPGFWAAGNLWAWLPQARVTAELGNTFRVGLQGAALDPVQTSFEGYATPQTDAGEKSGKPSLEGRLYLDWGDGDEESTVGFGVHQGWIATASYGTLISRAVAADFRIVLGGVVTLAGEAFQGQALAGLGDGGVDQNFGPQDNVIRSKGGWAQLNVHPGQEWEFGGGAGMDDPTDSDFLTAAGTLPASARLKNVQIEGHVHFKPGGGLLLGAEFWRFQTTFPGGTLSANQINVFAGYFF